MDENILPKKNVCFPISDRPYQNMWDRNLFYEFPPPPQKKKVTVIKVTIKMLRKRDIFIIYCISGNFRVLKFPRISDFGPFHEV